jgi:hypothetical protein
LTCFNFSLEILGSLIFLNENARVYSNTALKRYWAARQDLKSREIESG